MDFQKIKTENGTDIGDLSEILKKAGARCGILAYWDENGITIIGNYKKDKFKKPMEALMNRLAFIYEQDFQVKKILEEIDA